MRFASRLCEIFKEKVPSFFSFLVVGKESFENNYYFLFWNPRMVSKKEERTKKKNRATLIMICALGFESPSQFPGDVGGGCW